MLKKRKTPKSFGGDIRKYLLLLPFHLFSVFNTFHFFSASVLLFCFSLLLDPIFLFISTFSCKWFSPASAFIYRKSHYVTSGNFNICLKRTAFWKHHQEKKNTGGGGGQTLLGKPSSSVGFCSSPLPISKHPRWQLKAVGHPN